MSTILKALRRLEQERAAEQPSPIQSRVAAAQATPPSGRAFRLALLGLAVLFGLGGGALVTWLSFAPDPEAEAAPADVAARQPVPFAPAPRGEDLKPRRIAPPAPPRAPAAPPARTRLLQPASSASPQLERSAPSPPAPEAGAPESPSRGAPPVAVLQRVPHSREGAASPSQTAAQPAAETAAARSGEATPEAEAAPTVRPIQPSQVERDVLADRATRQAAPVIVRRSLPELVVKRTLWHPDAKRRVASVQVAGRSELIELREGDAIEDLTVVEITPTGVSFDHGGVELYKRLGAGG